MEAAGVTLEVPVARGTAHLSTSDTKLARRFSLETGRAPRAAKHPASGSASPSAAPPAKRPAAKRTRAAASGTGTPEKTPAAAKKPARQRKATQPSQASEMQVQTPARRHRGRPSLAPPVPSGASHKVLYRLNGRFVPIADLKSG